MKMRYLLLAAALVVSAPAFAQTKGGAKTDKSKGKEQSTQEDENNLVPNGGFEDCNIKNLKSPGQLVELCTPWLSPNKTSADLFAQGVKGTKAAAPVNDYGKQDPMTGTAYAGFRAFTKDPKKNRTYLQVKLNGKLEKDKLYCVRMSVSLAELSKYAVNNVGIFLSDRKVANQNDNALNFTPQVLDKTNKVINNMDGWETICGTYIATGNEEYIVIGGFGTEDKMKQEKMKKPAGVTGTVLNDAYYYVDNVEIFSVEANSQCFCGKAEDREPDLIYSRAGAKAPDMTPAQQINNTAVYFAFLSADTPGQFDQDLNDVLALLKSNPNLKIELTGHSDPDEVNESKVNPRYNELAKRRAEDVKKFFTDAGISDSRITIVSKDDSSPASTKGTPISKAQNRRVEFVVK